MMFKSSGSKMAVPLTPIVRWAQTKERLYLTIELSDVQYPTIDLNEDRLIFKAYGHGARGESNYQLEVNFLEPIDPSASSHSLLERYVDFSIAKCKGREFFWQRLVNQEKKPHWLKINFDKWKNEDDSEDDKNEKEQEEEDPQIKKILFEQRFKRDYDLQVDKAKQDVLRFIKKFYLVLFNLMQAGLFMYIVVKMLARLATQGLASIPGTYDAVSDVLATCQLAAIMEFIHPTIGLVKTSILTPFMQVSGRNLILFLVLVPNKELHEDPVVFLLFLVWSLIEIIRYPFYIAQTLNIPIEPLIWLRYSAWIPLYPLGILSEATLVWKAIPLMEKSQRFSFSLPNDFNFSFSFSLFLKFYLPFLFYGGTYMMIYMNSLRSRRYGRKRKAA
ncbi:very-long-chain (3R)-3-hydroxyacyl-CoA dehydratase-like [Actinia tenebrosa]|uniref:Very-long-chain (3R)-3-hydroxyacyl-CoA dehydratase n=1 Tax=Actinia tenebrosa TaxID=6105 RepID=A0A6P8I846_ACTTE|nr:very-long-chain (3R)-3-hydroxyacyl-CoA dehydratase-like [Actinia tenebrosa]